MYSESVTLFLAPDVLSKPFNASMNSDRSPFKFGGGGPFNLSNSNYGSSSDAIACASSIMRQKLSFQSPNTEVPFLNVSSGRGVGQQMRSTFSSSKGAVGNAFRTSFGARVSQEPQQHPCDVEPSLSHFGSMKSWWFIFTSEVGIPLKFLRDLRFGD